MLQLMLLTALCLVASILGYGYHTAQQQTRDAQQVVTAELAALGHNLASVSRHFILTNEPDQIEALTQAIATVPGMYSVMITDTSGIPLTEIVNQHGNWIPRYNRNRVSVPPPQGPDSMFVNVPDNPLQRDLLAGRGDVMVVWQRITAGRPLGWVRIKFRMDRFDEIATNIQIHALRALALGIAATLSLMWLLLAPALRALRQASDFAARLDSARGAQMVVSHRSAEIERLGSALNVVSKRLLGQNVDLRNQKFALDQHAIVSITDLNGAITYANDRFCQISGYDRNELVGKNHRIVRSAEHPAAVYDELWRTISEGKVWHGDLKNRKKDGNFYWVNTTIVPLVGSDGLPHQYIGIRTDITANKALEHSLQSAKEQAEAATVAKGQFLANMSHEIRTPMNAILGMLQLLQRTPLTPQQLDYAGKAESAAQSLLGLVNDILDFSKIEAGKMVLDAHPFALDTLVHHLSVIANASIGSKPLNLHFEVDPQVPPWLHGDALRLQQVLINLCSNAIKFTAQGQVSVRIQWLAHSAQGTTLRFAVSDTGIGIAHEHQQHIFEGFSQAEASTTRRFGGTGLGLSISSQLVGMMGSRLQLESVPGQGSTFWFDLTLPIAEVTQTPTNNDANPTTPTTTAPLQDLRLLVVEDNPINQQVAQELLQAKGAMVTLADNGQLGVLAVQNAAQAGHPFDLVLMDLQMPVMDGFTATRVLRQQPALHQLPIVAMTANAMDDDRAACLAAGMSDHIGKPFNLTELVALIQRLATASHTGPARPPDEPVDEPRPAVHSDATQPVDSAAALARLGHDQSLYARVVKNFLNDATALPQQVATHLQTRQFEAALRALHNFKGLSGTAGAAGLSERVKQLEHDLRVSIHRHQPLDASTVHATLVDALIAPVAALQTIAQTLPSALATATYAEPAMLAPRPSLLRELLALLQASDLRALEVYEQLRSQGAVAPADAFIRIGAALEQLDFATAAAATRELLQESAA